MKEMLRSIAALFLLAVLAFGATVRLYLKDGTYQLVREYQVTGDRVRFYSTERSDWEEIPLSLVDLQRTKAEAAEKQEAIKKEASEIAAEDEFERKQREEVERIPMNSGVFIAQGEEMKELKAAESKVVGNKRRSVLKAVSPVPVVSGKSTLELQGEHAATVLTTPKPEFYIRLSEEERFGIVKLTPKKDARVVQRLTIIPITKEIVEEQDDVEIFRRQLGDMLYKIWPMKPLEPGEYAVIEYTQGKLNTQIWDFAYKPAR